MACTAGAFAAVSVQVSGPLSATAGSTVSPALVYGFDAGYSILSFDLDFDYDPTQLSFNAASSYFLADGQRVDLSEVEQIPGLLLNYGTYADGRKFGDLSVFPLVPVAAPMQLVFNPSFTILAGLPVGTVAEVRFNGTVADDLTGEETTFGPNGNPLAASITVSAVPEPAEWMLLAAGLLTVGAFARRRS